MMRPHLDTAMVPVRSTSSVLSAVTSARSSGLRKMSTGIGRVGTKPRSACKAEAAASSASSA